MIDSGFGLDGLSVMLAAMAGINIIMPLSGSICLTAPALPRSRLIPARQAANHMAASAQDKGYSDRHKRQAGRLDDINR